MRSNWAFEQHLKQLEEYEMVGQKKNENWYEEWIEQPIRDVVKLLRDNGFNTECSCGHEMYVQCQYLMDGDIHRLHQLIWHYLHNVGKPIDFEIAVLVRVMDGHAYSSLNVEFGIHPGSERKSK